MKIRLFGLLVVFSLGASAQTPKVRTDMLVSTNWLDQHLKDGDIVILHVSRDRKAFDEGHIPGARFLALSDFAITRDGILNELAPAATLKTVFERAGVSDNSRVILYGDTSVLPATRAWFTLDYLGHDSTALLDGGLPKWTKESRPLAKDNPDVKQGRFTPRPRPEVVVDINAVKDLSFAATNAPNSSPILVDARTANEFNGGTAASSEIPHPGHIPGAANVYWMDGQASKNDMTLLPAADLRKLYEGAGVKPDRPAVTYCNTGMQASQSYFTLKYLGYDTRMYDGSFSEWSNAKDAAVEKKEPAGQK
ncbi:MAG TPA: sulfurtransferase [Bryobacteraceae bacterium]|jgi:thiosulfate/3-mercaptopyruvate sulfurtransferase|nr:sulfurtransferase [Bryobacteraceae bacterium]